MQEKETVYLAGKISGDPYFRSKFYDAAKKLEETGFVVLNPAVHPAEGFSYEAYIRMSRAMQDECQAVCFLSDWTESLGAQGEFGRAYAKGQRIFFYDEWLEELKQKVEQEEKCVMAGGGGSYCNYPASGQGPTVMGGGDQTGASA